MALLMLMVMLFVFAMAGIGSAKRAAIAPASERRALLAGDPYRHDADHWCVPFIPNEALGLRLRWLWGWRFVRRRLCGHWERWQPIFLHSAIWVRVPVPTTDANIEINRHCTSIYCSIHIREREHW